MIDDETNVVTGIILSEHSAHTPLQKRVCPAQSQNNHRFRREGSLRFLPSIAPDAAQKESHRAVVNGIHDDNHNK
jgi:hypothetical protein